MPTTIVPPEKLSPAIIKTNGHGTDLHVSEQNQVFVLRKQGEFFYETRKTPQLPSTKHVLIQVIATGICGSDVHYWKHGCIGSFTVKEPLILGHESAGIVVRLGSDIKSLRIGDRVAIEPGMPCRTCTFCRSGKYNLCDEIHFAATPPVDGTLTAYYTVPEDFCYILPKHISIEEGALVEPLSIAVHCTKLANIGIGNNVLIMGAGPIGLLCCAVAKSFGASAVVVTDIVDSRLKFALKYAATHTYKMRPTSPAENAQNILIESGLPSGADVVIDATGVQSCIAAGIFALKKGGTFIQAGLGATDISFPVGELCSKEGLYKTSFRYGPGDYALAIELLASKRINLGPLITNSYEFDSAEQAFVETGKNGGIKSIIYGPRGIVPGQV
ncbi:putative xylitol dehydrogenase [Bisporella sp. PMI_857]|nr:putative xylitol dehydrogenase [Bisporella sp. PMI_857]